MERLVFEEGIISWNTWFQSYTFACMCALVRHNVFLAVSLCHKNLGNTALAERECEACPISYWWTLLTDALHQIVEGCLCAKSE